MADTLNVTLSGVDLSPLSSYQTPDNPYSNTGVGFTLTVSANTDNNGEYTKDPNSSRVYTSSNLGFELNISRYNQALPWSIFKNVNAPLTTQMAVEDIPTKYLRIPPTMDSYVREHYPNMNYGSDGLVVSSPAVNGEIIEAYYQFSLVDSKGVNILSSIPKGDILESYFETYNPGRQANSGEFSMLELPKGSWVEHDVNWWDKPATTNKVLGTVKISTPEGYNKSSSLIDVLFPGGTGVAEELNFSIVNTVQGSTAAYSGASKESIHQPYLVIKMVDSTLYNSTRRNSDFPFSIQPKILNHPDHLPFDLLLQSKNIVLTYPVAGGVTTVAESGQVTVSGIGEAPFSLTPCLFDALMYHAIGGVSIPAVVGNIVAPFLHEIGMSLTPRIRKAGEQESSFGVATVASGSAFTPSTGELGLTLTPRVHGDDALASVFGATTGVQGKADVQAIDDLPMSVTVRQHALAELYSAFGISTAGVDGSVAPGAVDDGMPFTLTVEGRSFMPFELVVMSHSELPFTMDMQPVSGLPFNIQCVLSPQIAVYITPRVPADSAVPFTMTVRVRNANTLPFSMNSNLASSYITIV